MHCQHTCYSQRPVEESIPPWPRSSANNRLGSKLNPDWQPSSHPIEAVVPSSCLGRTRFPVQENFSILIVCRQTLPQSFTDPTCGVLTRSQGKEQRFGRQFHRVTVWARIYSRIPGNDQPHHCQQY
jgi:hypothetical protein